MATGSPTYHPFRMDNDVLLWISGNELVNNRYSLTGHSGSSCSVISPTATSPAFSELSAITFTTFRATF